MGPATQTTPPTFQGVYPAFVAKFNGEVSTDLGDAPASTITYDVWVNFPDGPELFQNVAPKHRRPSSVLLIIPAQPNDECLMVLRGSKAGFIIFEELSAGEECG